MLLRRSLSNTKKFFQRTIRSVKSLFSRSSYQRLPKIPPLKPFSCLGRGGLDRNFSQSYYRDLDQYFYSDFTNRWDGDELEAAVKKRSEEVCNEDHIVGERKVEEKKRLIVYDVGKEKEFIGISSSSSSSNIWLERRGLVEKKLKELEMMDLSNVENVLDIEEVLHYYSRLTCPVYIDIFDRFFIHMYSDLFNLQAAVAHGRNWKTTTSRPRLLYRST